MLKENLIRTWTDKIIDPLDPDPEQICIEDITHSLSQVCRWGGHCLHFYSVAQHSINVMDRLTDSLKPWGLMHDAAEAYIGDIVRPIKDRLGIEKHEQLLLQAIAKRFDLEYPIPDDVWIADDAVLEEEWKYLVLCDFNGLSKEEVLMKTSRYRFQEIREVRLQFSACFVTYVRKIGN